MKDIITGVAVKILSIIVIVALLVGGVYLARNRFINKLEKGHEETNNVEIIKEKLKATAELNTGSYLCTVVLTKEDSKTFKKWKIPFTEKSFTISYDGTVKAGIRDLTKAKISQDGDTIIVKLPEVEITGSDLDNDSFKKLDESNNIFNPINVEDINDAQQELKDEMINRAIERGVLDVAKNNAELLISSLLASPNGDYEVKIEWQ